MDTMRKLLLWAMGVAFIAASLPASGEEGVRELNRAWLMAQFGDRPLLGQATIHGGGETEVVPISEAIEVTLDRWGDVDAASLATMATNGEFPAVLDVWLYEVGVGSCPQPMAVPLVRGATIVSGDQVWLYGGPNFAQGYAVSDLSVSGYGQAIEWAWKTAWTYHEPIVYGGHTDFFCFEFQDLAVHFPWMDGFADAQRGP